MKGGQKRLSFEFQVDTYIGMSSVQRLGKSKGGRAINEYDIWYKER